MSDELKGFTDEQVKRIIAAVLRLEKSPRGSVAGPSTYRPPSYSVAMFKMQGDISDSSTSGVSAKFWYSSTEGDEVTVYPFGLTGTVASGKRVLCAWWDDKWWVFASEECPS